MAETRVQLECCQCAWAANSTDMKTLDRLAALHEQRNPNHQVVERR